MPYVKNSESNSISKNHIFFLVEGIFSASIKKIELWAMRNVPIFLFLPSIIKSAISSISHGEGHSNGQIPKNKIVSNSKIFRRVSIEYLKKMSRICHSF